MDRKTVDEKNMDIYEKYVNKIDVDIFFSKRKRCGHGYMKKVNKL